MAKRRQRADSEAEREAQAQDREACELANTLALLLDQMKVPHTGGMAALAKLVALSIISAHGTERGRVGCHGFFVEYLAKQVALLGEVYPADGVEASTTVQ